MTQFWSQCTSASLDTETFCKVKWSLDGSPWLSLFLPIDFISFAAGMGVFSQMASSTMLPTVRTPIYTTISLPPLKHMHTKETRWFNSVVPSNDFNVFWN